MPAFLIPLGIAAAQTAMGFIQQQKADKEARKLRQATIKNMEESRREQLEVNRRAIGEAKSLTKNTSIAAELMKEEAKGDASDALSQAVMSGGRSDSVKNAVALAMKKSRGANVDAAKINESRQIRGKEMVTSAINNERLIKKQFGDQILQLMSGQANAVGQLGQAGIKNIHSGVSDMASTLLAEKMGLFSTTTAAAV